MAYLDTYPMKSSTILRLYSDREAIDTNPDYQRRSDVWTLEKKQLLIDSILNDYDIPKLYFHALPSPRIMPDGREVMYAIVDGRQRIETVWQFIEGKFKTDKDFEYTRDASVKAGDMTYAELADAYPRLKINFDSFVLPVVCIRTDDIDLIEDMFCRLNEAVPLNAAEKRNAIGGPMVRTIVEISGHEFFTSRVSFTDRRYQHREVAVRLLFLEYNISTQDKVFDTKKTFLDRFVKDFRDNPDLDPRPVAKGVKSILNVLNGIFEPSDQLLRTQASIPVYYILALAAKRQGSLANITHERLVEFRDKVDSNRLLASTDMAHADYDLLEYDRMTVQGTNDAGSIKERVRIICTFMDVKSPTFK
jgi:hypothetical protein